MNTFEFDKILEKLQDYWPKSGFENLSQKLVDAWYTHLGKPFKFAQVDKALDRHLKEVERRPTLASLRSLVERDATFGGRPRVWHQPAAYPSLEWICDVLGDRHVEDRIRALLPEKPLSDLVALTGWVKQYRTLIEELLIEAKQKSGCSDAELDRRVDEYYNPPGHKFKFKERNA